MKLRQSILGAGLVVALAAGANLLMLGVDEGTAKPKRPGGTMSCTCACDSGATGITPDVVYSQSPVTSCGQLNGQNCNRERTVNGVTTIVSGKLDFCNQTPGTSAAAQLKQTTSRRTAVTTQPATTAQPK